MDVNVEATEKLVERELVKRYSIIVGFCLILVFVVPCMMLALLSKCCQKSSTMIRKGSTVRRTLFTFGSFRIGGGDEMYHGDSDYSSSYGVFGLLDISASKVDCFERISTLKNNLGCIDTWKAYAPPTLFGGSEDCEKIIAIRKLSGNHPRSLSSQNDLGKENHSSCLKTELSSLSRIPPHHSILNLLGVCKLSSHVYPSGLMLEYPLYGSLHSFLVCKRRGCLSNNTNLWAGLGYRDQEDQLLQALPGVSRQYLSPLLEDYGLRSHPFTVPLNEPLNDLDVVLFALQIAQGMDFLTNAGVIHKHLSTENIIISTGFYLKLSGMCGDTPNIHRNVSFRRTPSGRNMMRWDAPEILEGNEFTEMAEVWRYGMILWEICSLGDGPFGDTPGRSLKELIKKGDVPHHPERCSEELYSLMKKCWYSDPSSRPSFMTLVRLVTELLQIHEEVSAVPTVNSIQLQKRPSILRPILSSSPMSIYSTSPDTPLGYVETDV